MKIKNLCVFCGFCGFASRKEVATAEIYNKKAAAKSQPQRDIKNKPQRSRNRNTAKKFSRKKVATAIPQINKAAKKSQPQYRSEIKPLRSRNRNTAKI